MINRCRNKKQRSYELYGGRGIKVDRSWESFENFYKDMGDRPEGYSIERIDPKEDYKPGNCKWIPYKDQGKNTRKIVKIKSGDKTLSLLEFCKTNNLKYGIIYNRIRIKKWDIKLAIETPVRPQKSRTV